MRRIMISDYSGPETTSIIMIGAGLALVWTPWALLILGIIYFVATMIAARNG